MLNSIRTHYNYEPVTLDFRSDIKSIRVNANRWFQKMYGFTSHKVYVDVELESGDIVSIESGIEYGYGENYRVTAGVLLAKHGFFTNSSESSEQRETLGYVFYTADLFNRHTVSFKHVDVDRKRDL